MTDLITAADQTTGEGGTATGKDVSMFTFGDPESVIDGRDLWSYFEMYRNADWYEPPLPMINLAKAFNMSAHHRSAIALKVNLLMKHFVPTPQFDRANFERWAMDFLQMGNGYVEARKNRLGGIARLRTSPAVHTRVGVEEGAYWWIKHEVGMGHHEFDTGSVYHIMQPEPLQEVYGIPEWLSALQSGLLNENATLFRRRYYKNGAHAGFVFYVSEPLADTETVTKLRERLQSAKGVGNFKNMFVNIPGGKKDGIQIMPIADVVAKDEFSNIKNITRDDMLAAHRVPPQLIGIIPQNNGGFGDVGTATDIFFDNEIEPIMLRMLEINDWAGAQVLRFRDYVPKSRVVAA
ncbi:phage portal protein [Parasphingorhabdus sp. JC815]|uniref:phage portal protein n=1 Tax=Parasphingorhabdus sp. JC815 TaxID=3232140 RepID=UPI0034584D4D